MKIKFARKKSAEYKAIMFLVVCLYGTILSSTDVKEIIRILEQGDDQ